MVRSGAVKLGAQICETVTLDQKQTDGYTLSSDSAQVIAFGGVANAHVVIITCDEPCKAALTCLDGSAQVVDFDDLLLIISRTNPYTAITVTRTPATLTNISVFLGEKA